MANTQTTPPTGLSPSGGMCLGAMMTDPGVGSRTVLLDTVSPGFTDGIEDIANNKITVTKAGLYLVVGQVMLANVPADLKNGVSLVKNLMTYIGEGYSHSSHLGNLTISISKIVQLAAGDDIQLYAEITDATVDIAAGEKNTFLGVQWLR